MTISTSPKTKVEKTVWWIVFALMFGFIAYVIVSNVFF
jgi:hypothetical protein